MFKLTKQKTFIDFEKVTLRVLLLRFGQLLVPWEKVRFFMSHKRPNQYWKLHIQN